MKTIKEIIEEQYPVGAAADMLPEQQVEIRTPEVCIVGTEPDHERVCVANFEDTIQE